MNTMHKLLALDCSTDTLSLAAQHGAHTAQRTLAGGAHTSAALLPQLMALLQELELPLSALDAIVVGAGPGAFTGLRAACSVAQGLALGAGLRIVPVPTLLAVAEAARAHTACTDDAPFAVLAALDARMGQVYHQPWLYQSGRWQALRAPAVDAPNVLDAPWLQGAVAAHAQPHDSAMAALTWTVAGNAQQVYPDLAAAWRTRVGDVGDVPDTAKMDGHARLRWVSVLPQAAALLRLCALDQADLTTYEAAQAHHARPLYVRDQVALTTEQRLAAGGKR